MMQEFNKLMSTIDKGEFKPFYLLSGTEPYFIDLIENHLTKKLTDESSRSFDYSLFYGNNAEQSPACHVEQSPACLGTIAHSVPHLP